MELERDSKLKYYRLGNTLPDYLYEEPRKPIAFITQLLDGKIEEGMRQRGVIHLEAAEYVKESMRYIAEKMRDSLKQAGRSDARLSTFPLAYALDYSVNILPKHSADIISKAIDEVAVSLFFHSSHKRDALKVKVSNQRESLIFGTPLSINYLYSEDHFDPTQSSWWNYRENFMPLYERVGEAMNRYLDPDFTANSQRTIYSYKDIKSGRSK